MPRLFHAFVWPTVACFLALPFLAAQDAPAKLPLIHENKQKDYTEKITDKVSLDMVAIPGGVFLMGSLDSEKGRKKDEGPQHPVEVKPFWMGKYEIRWDEYDLYREARKMEPKNDFDKAADAVTRPTPPYVDPTFGYGRDNNPVMNITHHAAMEFCRWLSAKTGKLYRLPTEAEWEWACRAGTTTAFSFGDEGKKLDDFGWFEGNAEEQPHKIGKKIPNAWGLYDMHGNVAEWCIDQYKKDYYGGFSPMKVALAPINLPGADRYPYVARGGSWIDPPELCRSAARRHSEKDWLRRDPQRPQSIWWMTDADYVGFRVVRAVEEHEQLKGLKSKVTRESN